MIKDFTNGKCSSGEFVLTENTPLEISIPDDALGLKVVSDSDLRMNIGVAPATPVANTLTAGAFVIADIPEVRILQNGIARKLYLLSASASNVKIEFWG